MVLYYFFFDCLAGVLFVSDTQSIDFALELTVQSIIDFQELLQIFYADETTLLLFHDVYGLFHIHR